MMLGSEVIAAVLLSLTKTIYTVYIYKKMFWVFEIKLKYKILILD